MMKRIYRFKFIGVLIIFCVCLFSCNNIEEDAQKYLPGKYFYEIPSGVLQVLEINPDFTFNQIIYSKNRKDVLFMNKGKMKVNGNKIKFENWLECYELADQKILPEPYTTNFTGVYWEKPTKNEGVLIILLDQTNYIFRKEK